MLYKSKLLFVVIIFVLFWGCKTTPQNQNENLVEYNNPILHLDYSDPDVVKVDGKYYMTASSFNCVPALPLLESDNLIDWQLVGYAINELKPDSVFSKPQHGNGVWAPSIRYHNNKFYIYYGDPDFGIYMLTAENFRGPWSEPHLVQAGKGWIDPCPFWDDNGKAWLVHAWAGSRAGIKSTLTLHEMSPDGKKLLDKGIIIFDGHKENRTVEGPKMYKKDGTYFVFAPAGGVTHGWQLVMASDNVDGPYKAKKVLHQGNTNINGPHQGGWVQDDFGDYWFIHFQDKGPFGRIVHMQPMNWEGKYPAMGADKNGDGIGEPVLKAKIKVKGERHPVQNNEYTDEFNTAILSKHWQWHANPTAKWGAPTGRLGFLRLNTVPAAPGNNLWGAPNLLLQKFPAQEFTASVKMNINMHLMSDRTGLLIMGYDYAYLGVEKTENGNKLVYKQNIKANKGGNEKTLFVIPWESNLVYLKVKVSDDALCTFYYSKDGKAYKAIEQTFLASEGKWIGAKVGLFALSNEVTNNAGYIDVDWFRVQTNE